MTQIHTKTVFDDPLARDGDNTILPDILDFNLAHNPDAPFFYFARSELGDTQSEEDEEGGDVALAGENEQGEKGDEGIAVITQREFARAAHRVAHIVRPVQADSTDADGKPAADADGAVVAVIANADTIHYQAVVMGIARAGLVPFPISPRNSAAAVGHLLRKTNCHCVLVLGQSTHALLADVATHLPGYELSVEEIPPFDAVFPDLAHESVREAAADDAFSLYPPLTRRASTDVLLYLHSSGSTGFPKPIPQTQRVMIEWCHDPAVTDVGTHDLRLAAMALPPFHTIGVFSQLLSPLVNLAGTCVFPPQAPHAPIIPNTDNVIAHIRATRASALLIVPTFLEVWAHEPKAVEVLRELEVVAFTGGPLVPSKGDALFRAGVKLHPVYGATEFGPPTFLAMRAQDVRDGDWNWIRFSPRVHLRWVPMDDGTFELDVLNSETHSVSVENLSDAKGYTTNDIFEKHPTKDDLFRIVGRLDDVLILASGEKTVPAPMEDVIRAHPLVKSAVMFGRQRNQVGILIEPREGHEVDSSDLGALARFRNAIWPAVEEANADAPAFSRIFKEMIIVTRPDKPMLRSPKGTLMRKATLNIYEQEIDDLYEIVESSETAGLSVEPPQRWEGADVEAWLLKHAIDIQDGAHISPDTDLFEQGFDSLSATFLRNRIIGALRSSSDESASEAVARVAQNIVFSHPTIVELAQKVIQIVHPPSHSGVSAQEEGRQRIENMIKKYSSGLGNLAVQAEPPSADTVVLLTGTTGALGSHVLESLLKDDTVTRVYAYNRPASGRAGIADRQNASFVDRGLDVEVLSSPKLVYIEGDAAAANLGLAPELYQELRESTTVIIHNAWRVDFNLALSSFESNIRGTRNLIDFALSASHASSLRFLFTSSISSAQSWDRTKGPYPEEVQLDAQYAVGAGYGEGKYVVERLLALSGLQASSLRIGQISGGYPNGAWATTDWVPIFVKSSLAVGCLPSAIGVVSWIPAQAVAQTILDVMSAEVRPPLALNIVHPRPVSWQFVIASLHSALVAEMELDPGALNIAPFEEWLSLVQKRALDPTQDDLEKIPAIKLLEFFGEISRADANMRLAGEEDCESCGLKEFSTTQVQIVSSTMGLLDPLGPTDVHSWVKYWLSKGFLGTLN